jgi:NADH dehydrogenase [ubiquinone] 1 alpha subcomplex assembly factor 5
VDTVEIEYPNAFVLMEHLGRMGESNAAVNREEGGVGLSGFLGAAAIYQETYSSKGKSLIDSEEEEDGEGGGEGEGSGILASAQVLYAIGWKDHESQQKPDQRGSGSARVGEDFDVILDKGGRGGMV